MMQDLNPDDFRVPATDANGHTARYWGNCPPLMDVQIGRIVTGGFFPYRSKPDVVRHAIRRHLEYLENLRPIPSVIGQLDAIAEIVRENEIHSDFQESFEQVTNAVNRHLNAGRQKMAVKLLKRIVEQVSKMPEDSDWRAVYEEEINKRFTHILQGQPASMLKG
jgi:hypothetical protein